MEHLSELIHEIDEQASKNELTVATQRPASVEDLVHAFAHNMHRRQSLEHRDRLALSNATDACASRFASILRRRITAREEAWTNEQTIRGNSDDAGNYDKDDDDEWRGDTAFELASLEHSEIETLEKELAEGSDKTWREFVVVVDARLEKETQEATLTTAVDNEIREARANSIQNQPLPNSSTSRHLAQLRRACLGSARKEAALAEEERKTTEKEIELLRSKHEAKFRTEQELSEEHNRRRSQLETSLLQERAAREDALESGMKATPEQAMVLRKAQAAEKQVLDQNHDTFFGNHCATSKLYQQPPCEPC